MSVVWCVCDRRECWCSVCVFCAVCVCQIHTLDTHMSVVLCVCGRRECWCSLRVFCDVCVKQLTHTHHFINVLYFHVPDMEKNKKTQLTLSHRKTRAHTISHSILPHTHKTTETHTLQNTYTKCTIHSLLPHTHRTLVTHTLQNTYTRHQHSLLLRTVLPHKQKHNSQPQHTANHAYASSTLSTGTYCRYTPHN